MDLINAAVRLPRLTLTQYLAIRDKVRQAHEDQTPDAATPRAVATASKGLVHDIVA